MDRQVFFISDTHFGHEATVKSFGRPFANVAEMDDTILKNWQAIVNDCDTVYMLGDLYFDGSSHSVEWYLKQLPGRIHLLCGNHDKWLDEKHYQYFESIRDYVQDHIDYHRVIMSHVAELDWVGYMRGALFIHGHTHSSEYIAKEGLIYSVMKQIPTLLNATVEINHYSPVTLTQLIQNNQVFYGKET